jgi:hypothetical protein
MSSSFGLDPEQPQANATWPVEIDGDEISHLKESYSTVEDDEWDSIVSTARKILGQCPRPDAATGRTTGLALGKIQSGKTLSYTAVIALAIDNGYRITVVLAGTKNPLREQIYTRLHHDLAQERPTITPFENPTPSDFGVVQSVLQTGRHALIIVLKHRMRIDDVRGLLSAPEIRGYPTLIIDDEGDEASLNNQFRRGNESAIYAAINQLRDSLTNHAYVAYTATPQANLLISDIDNLAPDFGVLVEPGQSYCGGSVFFGLTRDLYVRELPTGEEEFDPSDPTPEGLQFALATFAVGGAILHLRNPNDSHSMLIHNTSRTAYHSQLHASVVSLLDRWKDTLTLPDTDAAKATLLALFRQAYGDLSGTVQGPPSWQEVSSRLLLELRLIEPMMVNSLRQGRDPIGTPFRLPNGLLVGGNMLSRGLTIPGLAVTYITRRARDTNADTMEQRARFFGYKRKYLDVCRIFLTHQLRDDYTTMLTLEDDFWEALRRNERQGLSIRSWPRMFALDMDIGLRPTRASVANYRQFRAEPSGWDTQTRVVVNDEIASANLRSVRQFFRSHQTVARSWGGTTHGIIEACPTPVVISELLARMDTEGTNWDNSYNKEYLTRLLLRGVLPTIQLMFMSDGVTREREVTNGRIQPMSGANANYPGDAKIHGEQPQIQVHIIRPTGPEVAHPIETTALALYLPPNDERFDLGFVVRGDILAPR